MTNYEKELKLHQIKQSYLNQIEIFADKLISRRINSKTADRIIDKYSAGSKRNFLFDRPCGSIRLPDVFFNRLYKQLTVELSEKTDEFVNILSEFEFYGFDDQQRDDHRNVAIEFCKARIFEVVHFLRCALEHDLYTVKDCELRVSLADYAF